MLIPFMNDGGVKITVANMRRKRWEAKYSVDLSFLSYHDITFKSPFFCMHYVFLLFDV